MHKTSIRLDVFMKIIGEIIMGCDCCKYWIGKEIKGVETCSATQVFRDKFCMIGNEIKNTKYTPKKKKRKK